VGHLGSAIRYQDDPPRGAARRLLLQAEYISVLKRGELLLEASHRRAVQEGSLAHSGHAQCGQLGQRRCLRQAYDVHRAADLRREVAQRVRLPQGYRKHAVDAGLEVGVRAPHRFGNELLRGPGACAGFEWMPAVVLVGALVVLMVPAFALIGLAVVALAAVAALVALAGMIVASPYLLARTVRRHLAERHQPTQGSLPIATARAA
jgi:hypothetical protein